MAQKFIQSNDCNFKVESVPSLMLLPNGSYVKTGFLVNRRVDNYAVLGNVTDRYGLIQNDDLLNAAEDAFKAQGMKDFTRNIIVTGAGERLYATYDFSTCNRKLARVGEEVGLRLRVQNSFDGSLNAEFVAGILQKICMNGAVTLTRKVGMTQKHSANVSITFVRKALEKTLAAWENSLSIYGDMAQIRITQAQGHNILANLAESNTLSGKLMEGVATIWDNPTYRRDNARNLYSLYNAVTQHLTHDVAKERFELADRVNNNVLAAFERATRDKSRLAAIIKPVPVAVSEVALN